MGKNVSPSDSITVISTRHRIDKRFHYISNTEYKEGKYLEYEFIVHNKHSKYHKTFTPKDLAKRHKSYWKDYRAYQKKYPESIRPPEQTNQKIDIDPAIKDITGYWIYLRKYNGQFYIDDFWRCRNSFHISDSLYTRLCMELDPSIIKYFKKDSNGDLLFETEFYTPMIRYKLIDKELEIYEMDEDYYIVPAKNAHHFEIIEYANNTGDCIF